MKENTELAKNEVTCVENQIEDIQSTNVCLLGKVIQVNHMMMLTMIDGKICNGTTSTQKCYICNATPKDMKNFLAVVKKRHRYSISMFRFRLSTLHAWIRFVEYIFLLSCRLEVKVWHVRNHDMKVAVSSR